MEDLDTGQTDAPTDGDSPSASLPEPVQGDAAPEAAPDDLESLLSIFDNAVGNGSQELVADPEGGQPTDGAAGQDTVTDYMLDDLVHGFGVLKDWAIERDEADKAERDQRDAEATFAKGAEGIEHFYMPEDYAERWLRAQSQIDPDLAAAFNERYASEEAALRWRRAERKALHKLYDSARNAPDPDLMANKAAVTAAVRGASKAAPEEDEIDAAEVRRMPPHEFEQWKKTQAKKLGY